MIREKRFLEGMGREAAAKRLVGKKWVAGRALLETDELIFRGGGHCKVRYRDITAVKASKGRLELKTANERYTFELEADASVWALKIQNPKTRLEKLGVKPNLRLLLRNLDDKLFLEELETSGATLTSSAKGLEQDLVLAGASSRADLEDFGKWKDAMANTGAVWVVYPKARQEITESDVLDAGRAAGLKDVKVVRFSETHTALKFVVPVKYR